jgi:predicted ArsR family transcriptional regulator
MNEELVLFYRSEKRHLQEKVLLLQALEKEFGPRVREIVLKERAETTRFQWVDIAKETHGISVKDMIETLWAPMLKRGLVTYDIEEATDGQTCLKVTSCIFARIVEELNIPRDWGFSLYCVDDEHMVKGFNPKMEFTRSKTLMEGHDCCNHCYRL